MDTPRNQVLFGAAYYHEYQPSPRLKTDLDLMVDAGFSVIRVGESVWTTWEPEEGRFDLDWLEPVLDGAHERGIKAILGTPTYAAPPWLARRYPEIAAETATGVRQPWGGRQEIDYSHPAFRFHAERIIRKIIQRYADHPAIIGYQVDNEPGLMTFHNHGVFQRFVDELRHTYGDVETLNEAWGLVYWSHELSTWADLWTPDGNFQPQYDLAWRRFQAALTTEFIAWQADIVREYARPDQFVTTCISYERPGIDDANLTQALDVTAGNPYYAMQDAFTVPAPRDAKPQGWTTSGAWSLFSTADRMFASKQAPFLVTETNAGAIGGPSVNFPAYDGQWRQAAWAFVARGAEMIEYWHWHTNHFGTETYWIGILPHDQQPGRVYTELAQLGRDFQQAGSAVVGLRPDAKIGFLYSAGSKWGLAFQSCFPASDGTSLSGVPDMDKRSYHKIFEAFYRGAFEAGVPARLLHDEHIIGPEGVLLAPAVVATDLPVLVVAGLLVADNALLDWLRTYAAEGGHLVLGPRTAYGDEEGRARLEVKPARLADAAGVRYQEFSNLNDPLPVVGRSSDFTVSDTATATHWVDGLIAERGEVLVGYDHPHFGRFPAVVTQPYGQGRITTVGTVPDAAFGADLARWLAPDATWPDLPASVTVSSATNRDGRRVHVIHNWSWGPVSLMLPQPLTDLLDPVGATLGQLDLGPWDVRVLAE